MDRPLTMTGEERQFAVERLESSRDKFLATIDGIAPAQAAFQPDPERWSILQCAEHIAISDEGLAESDSCRARQTRRARVDGASAGQRLSLSTRDSATQTWREQSAEKLISARSILYAGGSVRGILEAARRNDCLRARNAGRTTRPHVAASCVRADGRLPVAGGLCNPRRESYAADSGIEESPGLPGLTLQFSTGGNSNEEDDGGIDCSGRNRRRTGEAHSTRQQSNRPSGMGRGYAVRQRSVAVGGETCRSRGGHAGRLWRHQDAGHQRVR